jgi:predicted phosphoadenosine phosphosulfate sulfurtransferase
LLSQKRTVSSETYEKYTTFQILDLPSQSCVRKLTSWICYELAAQWLRLVPSKGLNEEEHPCLHMHLMMKLDQASETLL